MILGQVMESVKGAVAEQIISAAGLQTSGVVACVFLDKDGYTFSCQLAEGTVFPGEKDGHLLRCIEFPVREVSPLEMCTPDDVLESGKNVASTADIVTAKWYLLQCSDMNKRKVLLKTLFPAIWREAEKVKARETAALYLSIPSVTDKIKAFLSLA